jgi:hypothetical protein
MSGYIDTKEITHNPLFSKIPHTLDLLIFIMISAAGDDLEGYIRGLQKDVEVRAGTCGFSFIVDFEEKIADAMPAPGFPIIQPDKAVPKRLQILRPSYRRAVPTWPIMDEEDFSMRKQPC